MCKFGISFSQPPCLNRTRSTIKQQLPRLQKYHRRAHLPINSNLCSPKTKLFDIRGWNAFALDDLDIPSVTMAWRRFSMGEGKGRLERVVLASAESYAQAQVGTKNGLHLALTSLCRELTIDVVDTRLRWLGKAAQTGCRAYASNCRPLGRVGRWVDTIRG